MLRPLLEKVTKAVPQIAAVVEAAALGKEVPSVPDEVWRAAVHLASVDLGIPPPGARAPWVALFERVAEVTGDPDVHLPSWLTRGAPLGFAREVETAGVFPPAPPEPTPAIERFLAKYFPGWTNYVSVEDRPDLAKELVDEFIRRDFVDSFDTFGELEAAVEGADVVLNKVAIISKQRSDGTWKHRLIWDMRRSGANERAVVSERGVLPRL